jgi:hypothetical protein
MKLHIARGGLPWRRIELAECGRPTKSIQTIDRQDIGSYNPGIVCRTCVDTCRSWPSWEQNPVAAIHRQCLLTAGGEDEGWLETDLRAIAALIAQHPEEFVSLVEAEGGVIDYDSIERASRPLDESEEEDFRQQLLAQIEARLLEEK